MRLFKLIKGGEARKGPVAMRLFKPKVDRYNDTIKLSADAIDSFSNKIGEEFAKIKVEWQNIMRVRLSMEEMLLRFRDRFGEDQDIEVTIDSQASRPFVQVDLAGDIYNPLNKTEVEIEEWNDSLITAVGLSPQYMYAHGRNTLKFTLTAQRMNPALKIILAITLGVLVGVIGQGIFPAILSGTLAKASLNPLYELWSRILLLLSGPVIFFMVITTMLNTGAVSEQGGDTKRIVTRYFVFSMLMGLVAIVASIPIMGSHFTKDIFGIRIFNEIIEHTDAMIPENILDPLIEANTPQILALAFILGGALLVIGRRAEHLTRIVKQFNMVGLQITEWVSRMVPYVAGVLVALEILVRRTAMLRGMFIPFIISFAVSFFCIFAVMFYISRSKGVAMPVLFKKLWPPFKTALVTGSLDASYGQAEQSTITKLGVEKHYTQVELPQGLVLYMPINVIGTITFTVFAATMTDVQVSLIWILIAIVFSVILFVATPPVPGANLLAYIVIFEQLGIPGVVLIDAMLFDILFGIFAAAANQTVLQLELILQADRIGLLNRKRLAKQ